MCLTVKESLMYASKLKNSGYHGKVDHESNIKIYFGRPDVKRYYWSKSGHIFFVDSLVVNKSV